MDWVLSEMKIKKDSVKVLATMKGKDLEGVAYEPLFDYLAKSGKVGICF